ncbi:MAG: ice-binding family protein [Aquihabitans sp.]
MNVRSLRVASVALATLGILALTLTATGGTAAAATPPVGLGTAASYAVIAGSTITNTGPSVLNGDRGLHPGASITGFPPGTLHGASHIGDAAALQAKNDLTAAYNDAAGRTPATSVPAELGGSTFLPGTYAGATLGLTGAMTLDAGGDPDAVFLFKTNSTLVTASNSSVALIGSANPCNVYWQVSSSATLGTETDFVGTVMAMTSITANTGADVVGRLLARNGAVTLDNNVITRPICPDLPPGPTTPPSLVITTPAESTTTPGQTTTTPVPGQYSNPPTPGQSSNPSIPGQPTTPIGSTTSGPIVSSTIPAPGTATPGPRAPTTPGLPRTGLNLGVLLGLGLLALGSGVGILAMRRRLLTD